MSGSLRYKNPIICDHLAGQYIAGVMSPQVRSRVEALRLTVPELNKAIIDWSEHFSPIHDSLVEKTPHINTWNKIESALFDVQILAEPNISLWQSLRFWQFTGLGASFASVVFAVMLFVSPSLPITAVPLVSSTPSYMAVMSSTSEEAIEKSDIRFVVNVYQKTDTDPSRLFIQWSERQPRSMKANMHLWAKDRETGVLSYIGVEPNGASPWNLEKLTWQAISNSSELFFTNTAEQPSARNTLFSGPCIQLGSWKQNLT